MAASPCRSPITPSSSVIAEVMISSADPIRRHTSIRPELLSIVRLNPRKSQKRTVTSVSRGLSSSSMSCCWFMSTATRRGKNLISRVTCDSIRRKLRVAPNSSAVRSTNFW